MNKTLENDLATARKELDELKADLPRFHTLLVDNEREYAEAKTKRVGISHLALAKGRVDTAQELLQQHQHDIEVARAEVQRLEAKVGREKTLELMVDRAKTAKRHRDAQDKAIEAAAQALAKAADAIRAARDANTAARREFAEAGEKLQPGFLTERRQYDTIDHSKPAAMSALAAEAEAHGAPLDYALDNANGQLGFLDVTTQHPLPTGDFHPFVYSAVSLRDRQLREAKADELRRRDQERRAAADKAYWERVRGPETRTITVSELYGPMAEEALAEAELLQGAGAVKSQVPEAVPVYGLRVLEADLDRARDILKAKLPGCAPQVL